MGPEVLITGAGTPTEPLKRYALDFWGAGGGSCYKEYGDFLEDTWEEVAKYGPLKQVGREHWGCRGTEGGTWGADHWVGASQQPSSCAS
jgi:hypothetical protein